MRFSRRQTMSPVSRALLVVALAATLAATVAFAATSSGPAAAALQSLAAHNLVATSAAPAPLATAPLPPVASGPAYAPGEVVVGYTPSVGTAQQATIARAADASAAVAASVTPTVRVLRLEHGVSVAAAIARLRHQSGVAFAVPDYIAHIADAGTTTPPVEHPADRHEPAPGPLRPRRPGDRRSAGRVGVRSVEFQRSVQRER